MQSTLGIIASLGHLFRVSMPARTFCFTICNLLLMFPRIRTSGFNCCRIRRLTKNVMASCWTCTNATRYRPSDSTCAMLILSSSTSNHCSRKMAKTVASFISTMDGASSWQRAPTSSWQAIECQMSASIWSASLAMGWSWPRWNRLLQCMYLFISFNAK